MFVELATFGRTPVVVKDTVGPALSIVLTKPPPGSMTGSPGPNGHAPLWKHSVILLVVSKLLKVTTSPRVSEAGNVRVPSVSMSISFGPGAGKLMFVELATFRRIPEVVKGTVGPALSSVLTKRPPGGMTGSPGPDGHGALWKHSVILLVVSELLKVTTSPRVSEAGNVRVPSV